MILQVLIAMFAGWINCHQQQVMAYLLEENRTLHAKLGDCRKRLTSLFTLATPDTLMRWYKRLIAQKFDLGEKSTAFCNSCQLMIA